MFFFHKKNHFTGLSAILACAQQWIRHPVTKLLLCTMSVVSIYIESLSNKTLSCMQGDLAAGSLALVRAVTHRNFL